MNVRPATHDDIPAIVAMGARFYATTSYAAFADFCEVSARNLAALLLEQGVVLVAEDEGRPIGMVGLMLAPFLFNHALTSAHEVMWWVEPEARNTGAGMALQRAVAPACKEAGAVVTQMIRLANSPPQAEAMYLRTGYALTEHMHTKVL